VEKPLCIIYKCQRIRKSKLTEKEVEENKVSRKSERTWRANPRFCAERDLHKRIREKEKRVEIL